MSGVQWNRRTADELRALAARNAVVLLPVGAEQHGHHLPTGVDDPPAAEVCHRAALPAAHTGCGHSPRPCAEWGRAGGRNPGGTHVPRLRNARPGGHRPSRPHPRSGLATPGQPPARAREVFRCGSR
ncbi:creatininase family protein [Streptomyces sp. NPDC002513]